MNSYAANPGMVQYLGSDGVLFLRIVVGICIDGLIVRRAFVTDEKLHETSLVTF